VACAHEEAVPVESAVTGEVLAALCPGCDAQLPAEFLTCPHDNVIEITTLGEPPGRGICNDCGTSAWFGRHISSAKLTASLVAAGWDPASVQRAVASQNPLELKHRFLYVEGP
jgi:hypothetical protein